ncbi:MAG: hypothetical protein WAU36_00455 [Cyclobacteriaceae bacterium]
MKTCLILFLLSFSLISKAQGWGDNDSLRVIHLHDNGVKIEKGRVIAWFPKDSLSMAKMKRIVDTLNLGITKVEVLIDAPFSWQVYANKPVVYYFSPEKFISHASWTGYVFIPFWRIKEGKSPWLHEALHILLRTNTGSWSDVSFEERKELMPLWLTEGLPDYLESKTSYMNQLPRFDLWNDGGFTMTDASCLSKLNGKNGDYVLEYIGREGPLPELFGENRREYSPIFYNCSFSFNKYIGEKYGQGVLLGAISNFKNEHQVIESKTGRTIAQLKEDWLREIRMNAKK